MQSQAFQWLLISKDKVLEWLYWRQLKDLAIAQKRIGITLTCHENLISYYERNGFSDEGESESTHGGSSWYNMVWESPMIE